jgi:hypothetical protein
LSGNKAILRDGRDNRNACYGSTCHARSLYADKLNFCAAKFLRRDGCGPLD